MRASLIFLLALSLTPSVWAATVSQVKGNKLIIDLEGESAAPGTEFFLINSAGKRIGLATIRQIKGNRALGDITKGRAKAGDKAQLRSSAGSTAVKSNSGSESSTNRSKSRKKPQHTGGLLLGYSMNSMALSAQSKNTVTNKEDVKLTGSAFSVKGFYDYALTPEFTVRGALGLEGFNTKGNTSTYRICENDTSLECTVAYNYLALEGTAQYNFMTGSSRAWVGLGYSFLVAMTKKQNIPNLSESSTNQMILIAAGTDISLGPTSFIPLSVDYGMFPGSSNVSASSISARFGYGLAF
jgi:hypothetical protein